MEDFQLWFTTGLEHILDLQAYDHICYVVALSILWNYLEWKKLLWLITAFTVGHSLSLALSVLDVVKIPQEIIEVFIPLTIIVTCLMNIWAIYRKNNLQSTNYTIALLFGLVHGLGFSYLLKAMLGKSTTIIFPLFAFNIGLEVGQIIIVSFVLLLSKICLDVLKISKSLWVSLISLAIFCVATYLLMGRL